MGRIIRRAMWIITAGLVAGCGEAASPVPETPPAVVTRTRPAVTATVVPSATPRQAASPTSRPRPTQTFTPAPRAEVRLTLPDCDWTFGDPFARERRLLDVLEQPGILEVVSLSEGEVRLVYDPTRLTEQEAIQTFVATSGLATGEEHCP